MNELIKILKIPIADSVKVTDVSVVFHGIDTSLAFFLGLAIVVGTYFIYFRTTPGLARWKPFCLASLRSLLIILLLILLVKPVLLLTLEGDIRRSLLVLVDDSASMQIKDLRQDEADLKRGAIARDLLDPVKGLNQALPKDTSAFVQQSRSDLVKGMLDNKRLNLLGNLSKYYDLAPFSFGQSLQAVAGGTTSSQNGATPSSSAQVTSFWETLAYDKPFTAIGDAVRSLLDLKRGQPVAGILLITDGGNNYGSQPAEAAALAQQDQVPIYVYGVGITSPKDIIVSQVFSQEVAFVNEESPVSVLVQSQSMMGRSATLVLKLGGQIVDSKDITFGPDGEQNITMKFLPTQTGDFELEASIEPLSDEAIKDNNKASQRVRVIDGRIHVLLIEQKPRWEFRYLQAMLIRDRRLVPSFLLLDSPELGNEKDSPYLRGLPQTKEDWMKYEVMILGDIDPRSLDNSRLQTISDLTSSFGGGLAVIAGKRFMPGAYRGTPLENLLPVEFEAQAFRAVGNVPLLKPMPLELTPAGHDSQMLRLADKDEENLNIWKKLPGVFWTARVTKPKPGAEVLLTDPSLEKASRSGPMPVMAIQPYGAGQVFYMGTDETWRWRRNVGERYFTRMWGQILLRLGLPRLLGASQLTQLVTDKKAYVSGERITISGKLYRSGLDPVTDQTVAGAIEIKPDSAGATGELKKEVELRATPGKPGFYQGEIMATTPGVYTFSSSTDSTAKLDFQVTQPRLEFGDTALNVKLLKSMAEASGGAFYREEDLYKLPDILGNKTDKVSSPAEFEIFFMPVYFALMMVIATVEWILRKLWKLK